MNAPAQIVGAEGLIKIAIMAVGGQGGGVLANWVVALAEAEGYAAQLTSVAGVAQRTGATIYYIEMAPAGPRTPVFALSPAPGDVDVLVAAELMEAGRAVTRGFVTPDRTTVIASTHRILAVSEKEIPGDGRGDGGAVRARVEAAARKLECFDLDAVAAAEGSFISASLFGAIARSGALPFPADAFEAVIQGPGADRSRAAFRAALDYAPGAAEAEIPDEPTAEVSGPASLLAEWRGLEARIETFPAAAHEMLRAGLRKTVDYQDLAYGADYLDHIARLAARDPALARPAAKYLANAMCYDDILRVADLKTRASRDQRLRAEQEAGEEIVHVTEYFHARGEELASILPARLGVWMTGSPARMKVLDRLFGGGRRLRTDRIGGFTLLWLIAGLRRWRRRLLRHRAEAAHLARLIEAAETAATPELAAELLSLQRLIKGYSDTHARGLGKFDKAMEGAALVAARDDAPDWVRRLREAALADEKGEALEGALATIRSFAEPEP